MWSGERGKGLDGCEVMHLERGSWVIVGMNFVMECVEVSEVSTLGRFGGVRAVRCPDFFL